VPSEELDMVDDSGEKHIGKSEKNISQLESQIGTKDDNSIATRTERSKQESFCSDTLRAVSDDKSNSLQIVDGEDVLLDSHSKRNLAKPPTEANSGNATTSGASNEAGASKVFIPGAGEVELNAEAMLQAKADPLRKADGSFKDNLVAYDGYNKETGRFELGTNKDVEMFKPYVDKNNVVPFGGKVSCGGVGHDSTRYATLTLGLRGFQNGIERDQQVLNVNISDHLKVNGQDVFDGKPHRAVFPIAPPHGEIDNRHWKWIDATIQRVGTEAELVVYGISPSSDKPSSESQFDKWPSEKAIWKLKIYDKPHHASFDNFWRAAMERDRSVAPIGDWQNNYGKMDIRERDE